MLRKAFSHYYYRISSILVVMTANYNGLRIEDESEILNSESALLHLSQDNLHTAWKNIQSSLEKITGTFG